MTQPGFDFIPAPKRVADTSIEVYREIAPSLSKREQVVYEALAAWNVNDPTAYELVEFMCRLGLARDVNSVRPRLTALKDKGRVEMREVRRCSVTGKKAHTWRVKA